MKNAIRSAASLIPLLSVALPAAAQDLPAPTQPADMDETVVVTGRRTVDTPVEQIKQQASVIVDSITAEEIEKTSDTNLAEALDRVVGVSADSFFSSSDAGYVTLRGFDSRYNSMAIDGNPIWFSSQNNRGAQIGLFPSAIVKETSVYKTIAPDQDANSVGGHIALRTLRAFDGGTQPYFKAGGRLGLPEQGSRVSGQQSYQAYAAGKFTFGPDDRFGAVFGFNRQHTADHDDMGSVLGYSRLPGADGQTTDIISSNVFSRQSAVDKETRNTAIFAKLETRIEDEMYAFISGNLFDERKVYYIQRAGAFIAPTGGRTVTPTGAGTANFTNGQGQIREFDYIIDRKAKVLGAGLDLRLFDKGALALRGNYTDYDNDVLTRNLGNGFRLSSFNGSYDLNGDVPVITPSDPARYDNPANWVFSNSATGTYIREQPLRDNVYSLGANFNYNNQGNAQGLGFSAGISWVRLDRSFDENFAYYSLKPGVTLRLDQITGRTMKGNAAALIDYHDFWAFMGNAANATTTRGAQLTADYTLREDILALHAAAYFARGPLRLVAGMRYEHTTDETLTGQVIGGVDQPLERVNKYGKWLPNVQAGYDITDRLKLRLAFTKTLGRADFADFAPGVTTSFDTAGVEVINGSNGDLDTRVSTNYDASLEYYIGGGVLAAAVFHKDLAGEIFRQRTETLDAGGMLQQVRTVPLNNGNARLTGVEITANKRRLDFLPAPLDRFGLAANFTYLDATWDVVFTDGSARSVPGLRNQPNWMSSVRVSYDAGPIDFNVNYRGRGRAFTGTFGTTAEGDRYIRPESVVDLQFNLRPTDQLRLTFDVRNLTKEYRTETIGLDDSLYNAVGRGREFWLGLHYRY